MPAYQAIRHPLPRNPGMTAKRPPDPSEALTLRQNLRSTPYKAYITPLRGRSRVH